jgi:D-beta-D-heptose 7-phosphate kinase/D-beta-D-heptose 1-phosphate adenosyltransferase
LDLQLDLQNNMKKKTKGKKEIVVAVSGGFDPIHPGHVRLFHEAKKLGDRLVVILNNDNWINAKKGHGFMPAKERKEIIEALRDVDAVLITKHKPNAKDMSVCHELRLLQPDVFANGGDRNKGNIPEYALCEELGIKMAFSVGKGGKVQSSSWLLNDFVEKAKAKKRR